MATFTGNGGVVSFGATPTAMVQLRNWSVETSGEAVESSVIGDPWRKYLGGLKGYTASFEGFYDMADTDRKSVV